MLLKAEERNREKGGWQGLRVAAALAVALENDYANTHSNTRTLAYTPTASGTLSWAFH